MTTKREWLRRLKGLKSSPRPLSSAECDELILLLGGTTRPSHRPEVKIFGGSLRRGNWTAIAEVVFCFLKNAEDVGLLESELKGGTDPRLLAQQVGGWTPAVTTMKQARFYVTRHIETLGPMSAKNRAEAERMASKWFAARNRELTPKQIQNALDSMRQAAGLKRLGLAEWRELKRAHEEAQKKRSQPNE